MSLQPRSPSCAASKKPSLVMTNSVMAGSVNVSSQTYPTIAAILGVMRRNRSGWSFVFQEGISGLKKG